MIPDMHLPVKLAIFTDSRTIANCYIRRKSSAFFDVHAVSNALANTLCEKNPHRHCWFTVDALRKHLCRCGICNTPCIPNNRTHD